MKKIVAAFILSFGLIFYIGSTAANAATLTVTKIADTNDNVCDADCSLREAVFAASSGDTIEFASPLFDTLQTITLSQSFGVLTVTSKTLTINGRDANLTVISADNKFNVFFNNGGNVTLNNLTLTKGSVAGNGERRGAGIYNTGILTLNNAAVSSNYTGSTSISSVGTSNGGGIYNESGAFLYVTKSLIFDNHTFSWSNSRNNGAGIHNRGTANISGSRITLNQAKTLGDNGRNFGGGIYNETNATMTIINSEISNNLANGTSDGTINNTTSNAGGGIFNFGSITIFNSTISGNRAYGFAFAGGFNQGGGLYNEVGVAKLTNVTVSNNLATDQVPSSNNRGGGIFSFSTLHLRNTVIWDNGAASGPNLVTTVPLSTNDHNLYQNENANLSALNFNGGTTLTHFPNPGSAVINAGNDCVLTANGCGDGNPALTTDQRGGGFPRLLGMNVDIGAVEYSRVVTNANGSGAGSLLQTIADAAAGDTISFDPSFFNQPRTIPVTGGNLVINKNLTITGAGVNLLTLDGGNASRVLYVGTNVTFNLSDLRITRGFSPSNVSAGGILIDGGTLNAARIAVDNCTAGPLGGGIYNFGTLNLSDSSISNNSANNAAGIYNETGKTAVIQNSIVAGNTASVSSGGIGNSGTLNFYDSTLSGNTAPLAGGSGNGGFADFANSTVSGNRATNNKGGGIYNGNGATVHLLNTTITNNQADSFAAAGIWNENSVATTVRARNTIIAGNISGNGNPVDYTGGIVDLGNNMINIANPGLAPLGNYGGSTPTHALLANSPALNTGNTCVLVANACGITHSAYANDQRGTNAPRIIGASVDIGAFERNISFDQSSLPNGAKSAAYSQTLTVTRATSFAKTLLTSENFDLFDTNPLLAPFTFSIVTIAGQSLPTGLTLTSNGTISGTATTIGTFTFTVKAVDSDGMAGASQFTITIVNTPPTISGATISRQVGSPASNSTIATVGDIQSGASGVSVTITSTNPLNGVTVSTIVNTNGTVTANVVAACGATNATFTLRATDGDGATATSTLTVNVSANAAPSLAYPATAAVSFNNSQIVAPTTVSDNGTITFSIVSVSPALTTAPTVNASGVVSITNAQPVGNHVITVRATDNCGLTTDSSFTLNVTPPTKTVTKIADTNDGVCDADCSLREAIATANSGDTILFAAPLFDTAQTITLGSELSIAGKTISVAGRAANLTTISGNNQNRIFNIASNGNLTLNDLTIKNGADANNGGGIYNEGTLQINNCAIADNSIVGVSDSRGGGIYNANFATATITNSTLSGNSVSGSETWGGSVHNGAFSNLTISNSTISGNTVSGSSNFSNRGGGISNSNGFLTVKNSTISGNSATGGTNNRGGGIYSENRTLNLIGVTITNNYAGNSIYSYGGGFFSSQDDIILANSIISGNSSINNPNLFGTLNPSNYNLIDGDARLAPLGFYGGKTQTHALLPDSPAINAGNPAYNSEAHGINDQRGSSRVIGGRIDIGAFESNINLDQANLPNGNMGVNYSQQLSATRQSNLSEDRFTTDTQNFAPTVFEIVPTAGQSLPPGITLSPSGLLSGMPTQIGTYTFTVKATDSDTMAGVQSYSMQIFAPTAANVPVSGRITTAAGSGISNARVILIDAQGNSRIVPTNSSGYYRFENVTVGQIYIVSVVSKRFTFAPQIISVSDEITELNFAANE